MKWRSWKRKNPVRRGRLWKGWESRRKWPGLGGMFILPFTGILGAALMFSGVVSHIPCGSYQGGGLSAGRGCSRCGLSDWLLYSAPTADPVFVCACGYPVFYGWKGIVADCVQLYPDGDKGESEIKHDWRMKTGKLLRLWKRRIRLACLSDIRGRQRRNCIFPGTGARWNLAEDGNEQV